MYTMLLVNNKKVELENKELSIDYFLTETKQFYKDKIKSVYGIKVISKVITRNETYYEVESVINISYSKKLVLKLLDQLAKHIVTPVCLIEIIDELMTEDLIEELSS